MTDMKDRVARAICDVNEKFAGGQYATPCEYICDLCAREATAAIEAMREPTEAMAYAAAKRALQYFDDVAESENRGREPIEMDVAVAHASFQAAIKEALKDD